METINRMKSSATVNGDDLTTTTEYILTFHLDMSPRSIDSYLSKCTLRDTFNVLTGIDENVERLIFSRQSGQSYLGSTVALRAIAFREKPDSFDTYLMAHCTITTGLGCQ